MSEVLRRPMMSGHCAFPQTAEPHLSHERCHNQGAGNRANPAKEYSPCPCPCHFPEERFECANCGGLLAEATMWPEDEDGDVRYTHVDPVSGRATGEECATSRRASTSPEPDEPEDEDEPDEGETEDEQDEDDLFDDLADLMED